MQKAKSADGLILKPTIANNAGKYLTFKLADELYGVGILKVQEIIGLMEITRVPNTPLFVRGVINLRGKVIPVIDLRTKLGMQRTQNSWRNCIIILQVGGSGKDVIIGVIVDNVAEVLQIEEHQLENTPAFHSDISTDYILGIGKVDEKVIMLLDTQNVLHGGNISIIDEAALLTDPIGVPDGPARQSNLAS